MTRTFASVLIILLFVTGVFAQQNPYVPVIQPMYWGIEARALWVTAGLNLDDQAGFKASRTLAEIALRGAIPGSIGAGYSFTTGLPRTNVFTPTGVFPVGKTQFGQDPNQSSGGGSSQQSKPVTLDWNISAAHRVELAGPWRRLPVMPLLVAENVGLTLTATKDDGGETKTDTESFNQWFGGIGAELDYVSGGLITSARFAASDRYSFAEALAIYRFTRYASAMFGFQNRSFKFQRANLRINALLAGVMWEF